MKDYLRTGIAARGIQRYSAFETLVPEYSLTDPETYVRDGYRKNALVYRCVNLLANSVAQAKMLAVVDTPEGETELPSRDPLSLLIERPSPEYAAQADFLGMLVARLMLTGEAPYYKVPGERTGRIVELQELLSSRIEVKKRPDDTKVYLYRPDHSRPAIPLEPDELIFLRLRDPLKPDRGLAPLSAAARETDTDNEATDWRKGFLQNGGTPPGILTTEQAASEKQLTEWSVMWSRRFGGGKNAGKTPALGGGLKYQATGTKPDEMALPDLTGISETRICQAFGVPPILVGAKVGLDRSTYANYGHARRSFWEETVSPLLRFVSDNLTDGLTSRGDGRRVKFDTSGVPALQEDADKKAERIGKAYDRGAAKRNEYREAIGLDPDPEGDDYKMPSGEVAALGAASDGAS